MQYMIWVWLAAAVLFCAVEALTAGLVCIWFAAGAVAALIAAALGASPLTQLLVFVVVSGAALAATRPLVKKLNRGKAAPHTNADRVLGLTARVTEPIDNEVPSGAVYVDGKTWTARSADGSVIPEGALVHVKRMEGVRLFVELCKDTEVVK